MNLTARSKIYLAIGLLSAIISYLTITLNFFPHFGMAFSLITFALFTYKCKQGKTKDTKLYLAFSLLFSTFLFVRSEPLVTFLNFATAIFFGFLMLLPTQKDFGITDYVYAPFLFAIKSLFTGSEYFLESKNGQENSSLVKVVEVLFGSLVTIFLLAIVLPLLSSANPFFQKMVLDFWHFLGLENLLKSLGLESLFVWLLRVVFFLFALFIIPKILTLINKKGDYSLPNFFKKEDFPLFIPKVIFALVLVIFLITQLQFYFATDETLTSLGLTHSQRAREVFTQLSLVAAMVIVFIYNSRKANGLGKTLNWLLGVQGIFLTLMAFKSDFDYIHAWGLTYKRLYGLTFVTWISGLFVLLFENFRDKAAATLFVKKTIIFSGVILLAVNVLNFDYLIYHFQKASTGQGIDYTYLSTLSPDSLSYGDQILRLEVATDENGYTLDEYNNKNPRIIIRKIEYLQTKYSKFDLRTMNLLDFAQYQQIKSVDLERLRSRYDSKVPFKLQD